MKRRKFLTMLGATATVVVVGSFSPPILKPSVKNLARDWSNSLAKIPEASVGSLQPDTIRTLMAARGTAPIATEPEFLTSSG